jgi:hypothetical protein
MSALSISVHTKYNLGLDVSISFSSSNLLYIRRYDDMTLVLRLLVCQLAAYWHLGTYVRGEMAHFVTSDCRVCIQYSIEPHIKSIDKACSLTISRLQTSYLNWFLIFSDYCIFLLETVMARGLPPGFKLSEAPFRLWRNMAIMRNRILRTTKSG